MNSKINIQKLTAFLAGNIKLEKYSEREISFLVAFEMLTNKFKICI